MTLVCKFSKCANGCIGHVVSGRPPHVGTTACAPNHAGRYYEERQDAYVLTMHDVLPREYAKLWTDVGNG